MVVIVIYLKSASYYSSVFSIVYVIIYNRLNEINFILN